MPDVTKSLGSNWTFTHNLVNCQGPAVDLDVSDDYLIFDNQVAVDYTQQTRSLGTDGKMSVSASRTVHLCHVRLHILNFRDLLAEAAGHLNVGDARAELSIKELNGITPTIGDKLVAPSGTFFVFAVDYDHTAQMQIVWCRK